MTRIASEAASHDGAAEAGLELPPAERAFLTQFRGATPASPEAELRLPITGFVGRDLAAGRREYNLVGGTAQTEPRTPFKVVSFYTAGNGYDVHAARLRESLERFGLDHRIEQMDDAESWEAVCAVKSRFVLDCWRQSDVPVVWIDADAVLERAPVLFGALDADFAIHKWTWEPDLESFGYEFTSGTLYFGRTELAEALLEQWALRCAADPATWDQKHLEAAWCDVSARHPLRTAWLPRSYLQIDGAAEPEPAVVRHFQASRSEKRRRERPEQPQFGLSGIAVEQRRRNQLWRSAEQTFWIAEGGQHIIPDVGDDFPEGFDVGAALNRCLGDAGVVLEFGCGDGRIAGLFDPSRYVGVDINPNAVAKARRRNPRHMIRTWDNGQVIPPTDALLFYTVLLHVSDEAMAALLTPQIDGLCAGRRHVVIAELMDRRWRRDGLPPVFNRNPEDYILMMRHFGFDLVHAEKHPYARYDQPPWNVGRDSRITFLKFTRKAG